MAMAMAAIASARDPMAMSQPEVLTAQLVEEGQAIRIIKVYCDNECTESTSCELR